MIDELDDSIMTSESFQELDLVRVALVSFRIGAFKGHSFERIYNSLRWTYDRVDFGGATFAEDAYTLIWSSVDLNDQQQSKRRLEAEEGDRYEPRKNACRCGNPVALLEEQGQRVAAPDQ